MKQCRFRSGRRGTIVHEAAIAMVLAAVLLASVVQIMTVSSHQSRARHQRITATREAGDLMEQLMARSWDQLTTESVASITLSETCQATLPNAQLDIAIEASAIEASAIEASDTEAGETEAGEADSDDAVAGATEAGAPTIGDGAKQLRIQIAWRHHGGNREAPVQLVAWKYPRRETDR